MRIISRIQKLWQVKQLFDCNRHSPKASIAPNYINFWPKVLRGGSIVSDQTRKSSSLLFLGVILGVFAFITSSTQVGCTSGGSNNTDPTPDPFSPTAAPQETESPESTPTASPEGTPTAVSGTFDLDVESLSFSHDVGTTACPQQVGQIVVTSLFANSANFSVTFNGPLNSSPINFDLPSATTQVITVLFTCAQATSFTGSVDITAEGHTQSVLVNGNLN